MQPFLFSRDNFSILRIKLKEKNNSRDAENDDDDDDDVFDEISPPL
jgi:hypothetical protein